MRSGDMDAILLQQIERLGAVAVREHQFHACRLRVAREHRDAGVAPRDQNAIPEARIVEVDLDIHLAGIRRFARGDGVARGDVPRHGRWRRGQQALADAAQLHRLSGFEFARARQQECLLAPEGRRRRGLR